MTDPIKIGGRFGLAAKPRNGFPDGQQHFLKQIVAVIALGETIDDMMQNRAVLTCPAGETLLLFGNIHECSVT